MRMHFLIPREIRAALGDEQFVLRDWGYGEEAAASRDRGLRRCQSLSGGTLHRRAQPAICAASGGGRRLSSATTHGGRQLDQVFWLEEERVLSEDWVVRYKNRLLQLERQSQH